MLRRSRAVACLVITLAALWWTCALSAAEPAEPEMVDALNEVRARHGLDALGLSSSLEGSASSYAAQLMQSNQFGHASEIRASRRFRTLGEILAIQPGGGPRRGGTVRGWLRSPVHRSLILSNSFRWMGAGRASGLFGQARSTIWVVQFGS